MGLLAVAVEKRDVDTATLVGVLKIDDVGFVEEIGIKDHRSVLTMRDRDGFCSVLFEKFLNLVSVLVIVVFRKVPLIRGLLIPYHETAIL